MTRWSCVASLLLTGWASGCSCGDDDDDSGPRLAEIARVGSAGGTFALGDLVGIVPAGAVEGGGTVGVRGTVRDDVASPPGGVGPVYELELDREIREPITLELPYDPAELGGRSPLGLHVASSPDGLAWGCDPMTAPRAESTSVLAVVSHLSFWTLRYLPCEAANDCDLPERCFDPGPNGYCATPCASDADCLSPTYCSCGICTRDSCEQPANDCPIGTHCSVDEADQRGVCLPECTPLDRCGLPEEQQLCSPGGRCAFQESALCPDRYTCADDHTCSHAWCVPTDTTGCECGVDEGCACETPAECPGDGTEHEACANGEDEDGDGDIDCADLDCADEPGCTAGLPEDCAAPGDEDGDGAADCLDTECVGHPACAAAPITFQDPEFEDADWVVEEEQTSGPIRATYRRELAGGNPDAYRAMTHDFEDDDGAEAIRTFQRYVPATYDPGAAGAIESIDFGIDVRTDRQIGNGFLVFQAGAHFRAAYALHDPAGETWQPHVVTGLTEADFLADDGVTTPDFSAAGAPVAFGFMRASSSTPPTPQFSNEHGADNFVVTIYPRPVLPAEDCDNAADDDGDTLADCADPDCAADPACASGPWPVLITVRGYEASFSPQPQDADWVAFQDGDGPWVEVAGLGGVYAALVTDPEGRYGVAAAWSGPTQGVTVFHGTAAEGTVLDVFAGGAVAGSSELTGQLLGADECTLVAAGYVGGALPCGFAVYTLPGMRDLPADVLGLTGPDGLAYERGFLLRDQLIAGDTAIDIDFASGNAFDLVIRDRPAVDTQIYFSTPNLAADTARGLAVLEYGGIPLARQNADEGYVAQMPGAGGAFESVYFRDPIDVVAGVPPPDLPVFTPLTVAAVPYPLYAVDLDEAVPAGVEMLSMVAVGVGPVWTYAVTTGWLGAGIRLELPDLSAADGWQAGFEPAAGASGTLSINVPENAGDGLDCWNAPANVPAAREGLRCRFRGSAPFAF